MGHFVRMGVVMRMRMRVWMRVRMNLNGGLDRGMRMVVRVIMVVVVRNGVVVVVAPHAVCDPELAVFATVARHA